MKKQVPPSLVFGLVAGLVVLAVGIFWFTQLREPPPTDPRTISKDQIIDPDPPRTRDMARGRGGE